MRRSKSFFFAKDGANLVNFVRSALIRVIRENPRFRQ